ncbi:MAG: hypothetical protein M1836_007323 [Candelina mexicana]|nr:MAG: hypothetical protein M1836_007323 [Candelina mexicana]
MTSHLKITFQFRSMCLVNLVLSLLLSLVASSQTKRDDLPPHEPGYTLFYQLYSDSEQFGDKTVSIHVAKDFDFTIPTENKDKALKLFRWYHCPEASQDTAFNSSVSNLEWTLLSFRIWMGSSPSSVITLTPDSVLSKYCDDCSDNETCRPQFYCLMKLGVTPLTRGPNGVVSEVDDGGFRQCLSEKYDFDPHKIDPSTWTCSIAFTSTSYSFGELAPDQTISCDRQPYDLTRENWEKYHVDDNLQTALHGGVDEYGVYWEGQRPHENVSETIGRQFWAELGVQCSIKKPCQPKINCQEIGSFTGMALGSEGRPMKIPWVLLTVAAVANLNQQLCNTYEQALDAISGLGLDDFSIDDFSGVQNPDTDVKNSLAGLGSIFTVLGGLIPTAGPTLELVGDITSAVGTILGNAAPDDPQAAESAFAKNVETFLTGIKVGLEQFTTKLFAGEQIPASDNHSLNLTNMIKEGAWVSSRSLTDVSLLNTEIRIEVTARCIDKLWKTWPKNKMWVLFIDLHDDNTMSKCIHDPTGPNITKYCADGGVYYTYNFIEEPAGRGNVGYPWGGEKLENQKHIPLRYVTEASAKTYRSNKKYRLDPFNFNHTSDTTTWLQPLFEKGEGNRSDLSDQVARFPGSWTLPVCDASTWGSKWNWDYTQHPQPFGNLETHPPCICGPLALETYDWAKAAGLQGFETYWHRCEVAMRHGHFDWPEGVTFVDYPTNKDNEVHKIRKS